MTSVTQVLDYFTEPELLAWYLREGKAKCQRVSEEAKRVGSLVDQMVQADLRGQPVLMPPLGDIPTQNCWQAWEQFNQDHPEFEKTVVGIQTELCDGDLVGHPDIECEE